MAKNIIEQNVKNQNLAKRELKVLNHKGEPQPISDGVSYDKLIELSKIDVDTVKLDYTPLHMFTVIRQTVTVNLSNLRFAKLMTVYNMMQNSKQANNREIAKSRFEESLNTVRKIKATKIIDISDELRLSLVDRKLNPKDILNTTPLINFTNEYNIHRLDFGNDVITVATLIENLTNDEFTKLTKTVKELKIAEYMLVNYDSVLMTK